MIETLVACQTVSIENAVVRSFGYEILPEALESIAIGVVQRCLLPIHGRERERAGGGGVHSLSHFTLQNLWKECKAVGQD